MQSKNKPKPTTAESRHIKRLAEMDCVVCGQAGPSDVHEFEQGAWFASVPLCFPCHRGPDGWHGTRQRWTSRKMDMVKAINSAVEGVCT